MFNQLERTLKSFYIGNGQLAFSASHGWSPSKMFPGKWNVVGIDAFTTSGIAVVDDFGNLVQVRV